MHSVEERKYILSIAGFDPSSGAGITSDIKTFEAHGLYGLSVCTAVTVQNDILLKACQWIDETIVIDQITTLFERFSIDVVKIGIVQSWQVLLNIITVLKKLNPSVQIVLDPILKATSGYDFHQNENLEIFEKIIEKCTYITPNYEEVKALFPDKNVAQTLAFLSEKTHVYLKGGHREDKKGWDDIWYHRKTQLTIAPEITEAYEKHGSGCVLSSALAANLTKGYTMEEIGVKTKRYIEYYLNSHDSLLGTHQYTND